MQRRDLIIAGTAGLLAAGTGKARAATYPERPVRLIVPYPPGGPADWPARLLAQGMTEELAQSVVVDNRSGAGGVVGTDAVAKAPPDGYTLCFGSTGGVVVSVSILPDPPFDPRRDLSPITIVTSSPLLLMASNRSGIRSARELLERSKRGGGLNFGSSGPGATTHLAGEMLRMEAGLAFTHVPYRGAAPALTAVLAGEVDFAILDPSALLVQAREGALRPLAIASHARMAALPEVPTFAEAGLPDLAIENWYALLAPAGTPADRINLLYNTTLKVLRRPSVSRQFAEQGARIGGDTPDKTAAFMQEEVDRWAKVVKASGARME
ncbi:MAG TPA: tripartite tricarboxylate transporter substrate binding protein [Roseomonas sp.]|nr:tripartite tricarboxylate transporter substrate binding protein [Roseomonas sp.]